MIQLIKLSDSNILVSEEEVCNNDWNYCPNSNFTFKGYNKDGDDKAILGINKYPKKIIASDNLKHNLPLINYNGFEEKFDIIDVNLLAKYSWGNIHRTGVLGFIEGFNKANSINDKIFSLNDIIKAIEMARYIWDGEDDFTPEDISGCTEVCTYGWKNKYEDGEIIKYLQQPKMFNVEISEVVDNQIKILRFIS